MSIYVTTVDELKKAMDQNLDDIEVNLSEFVGAVNFDELFRLLGDNRVTSIKLNSYYKNKRTDDNNERTDDETEIPDTKLPDTKLSTLLLTNHSLTELTINARDKKNHPLLCLGPKSATAIATGLMNNSNSKLAVLNLYNNCIGNEGAIELLKAFKERTTLRNLDISKNLIQMKDKKHDFFSMLHSVASAAAEKQGIPDRVINIIGNTGIQTITREQCKKFTARYPIRILVELVQLPGEFRKQIESNSGNHDTDNNDSFDLIDLLQLRQKNENNNFHAASKKSHVTKKSTTAAIPNKPAIARVTNTHNLSSKDHSQEDPAKSKKLKTNTQQSELDEKQLQANIDAESILEKQKELLKLENRIITLQLLAGVAHHETIKNLYDRFRSLSLSVSVNETDAKKFSEAVDKLMDDILTIESCIPRTTFNQRLKPEFDDKIQGKKILDKNKQATITSINARIVALSQAIANIEANDQQAVQASHKKNVDKMSSMFATVKNENDDDKFNRSIEEIEVQLSKLEATINILEVKNNKKKDSSTIVVSSSMNEKASDGKCGVPENMQGNEGLVDRVMPFFRKDNPLPANKIQTKKQKELAKTFQSTKISTDYPPNQKKAVRKQQYSDYRHVFYGAVAAFSIVFGVVLMITGVGWLVLGGAGIALGVGLIATGGSTAALGSSGLVYVKKYRSSTARMMSDNVLGGYSNVRSPSENLNMDPVPSVQESSTPSIPVERQPLLDVDGGLPSKRSFC